MKKKLFLVIFLSLLFLVGCDKVEKFSGELNNNDYKEEVVKDGINLKLTIDGTIFKVKLEDTVSANELVSLLPLEISMNDLNNNEKYYYLDTELSTDEYMPKIINKGDIMLYQNNCLVIFYDSFNTSYSYTRLGRIENSEKLDELIGKGKVNVKLEME